VHEQLVQASTQAKGGAAAVVATCLILQLALLASCRAAYLSFGWRMYSRIASDWRLRPAEQQRRRALTLGRHRFAALARLDATLLALMLVVAAINAANPGNSPAQPGTVGLLVGAAVAAAPICGGWLAACWLAVRRRHRQLATALDYATPLCFVPPLLIIFTGEASNKANMCSTQPVCNVVEGSCGL
jgi:hypothetical protein